MGILSRMFKIGQAETNQLLDKLENPEKMIDQAIRDREQQIAGAREAIVKVIATEKQTKAALDRALHNKDEWVGKAEIALRAEKEDLAGQALQRSEEYEREAETYREQWQLQHAESAKLKQALREMESDFASLKRERSLIVAQSKTAEVKKDIYNAKAKIGKSNTDDLIERMREKARQSSYEADAAGELIEDSGATSLEKEFAGLEKQHVSGSVAEKLAAMKAKL
ncbi:PspA/IM30 family protein [Candidatus Haliotispira prima]|uniref:PspA/IM30 family protein n=1 Tax=Candidatus Haliotispira prima TaxID=3034016 RepID=A0ABY8MFZ6_9SPIO|nr:PspA/IM30 family protein [Candidatus Haliotispira prima]